MEDKFEEFKELIDTRFTTLSNSVDKRLKLFLWIIGIFIVVIVGVISFITYTTNTNVKEIATVMEWKKYCEDRIGKLETDNALIKKNALKKDRFNVSTNLMTYKIDELKAILEHNEPAIIRTREKIIEYQNKLMSLDNDDVTRGVIEIQ